MVKHERLWSLSLDQDARNDWYDELRSIPLAEKETLAAYQRFCERRPQTARIPRLGDVALFLRKQKGHRPQRHYRPPKERCVYCGDTGKMLVAGPIRTGRHGWRKDLQDFRPLDPYTKRPVYSVGAPCYCTTGQRLEAAAGLPELLGTLRDLWRSLYDADDRPGSLVFRYLRACEKARAGAMLDVGEDEIPF